MFTSEIPVVQGETVPLHIVDYINITYKSRFINYLG